ncbi:MAG: alpha/beta fold hydrolase [Myxococcota bacterium]
MSRRDRFIDAADERLSVSQWGAGDSTVVLVHGLGSSSASLVPLAERLAAQHRVIAVDLPGFGRSPWSGREVSIARFARAAARAVNALGVDRAIWVGHSMGGQIALRQALLQPTSISDLVLIAPAGIETFEPHHGRWLCEVVNEAFVRQQTPAQIRANAEMGFYRHSPDLEHLIEARIQMRSDPERLSEFASVCAGCVKAMIDGPVESELGALRSRTLIVFGEHDRLIPNPILHPRLTTAQIANRGVKLIPESRAVLVPEAGHMVHFERPDIVHEHIEGWLIE